MRADERKIFATTKAKSMFSNVYSCCHSLDDIMRATDVVFGGKRAFVSGFSSSTWLQNLPFAFGAPVITMTAAPTVFQTATVPIATATSLLATYGAFPTTYGAVPLLWNVSEVSVLIGSSACGRPGGRLRTARRPSADGRRPSADGRRSSTDDRGGRLRMARGRPRMATRRPEWSTSWSGCDQGQRWPGVDPLVGCSTLVRGS